MTLHNPYSGKAFIIGCIGVLIFAALYGIGVWAGWVTT